MNYFDIYRESQKDDEKVKPASVEELLKGMDEEELKGRMVSSDDEFLLELSSDGYDEYKIRSNSKDSDIFELLKKLNPNTKIKSPKELRDRIESRKSKEATKSTEKGVDSDYNFEKMRADRKAKENVKKSCLKEIDEFVTNHGFIPDSYDMLLKEGDYTDEEKEKFAKNLSLEVDMTLALKVYGEEHPEIREYTELRRKVLEFRDSREKADGKKADPKVIAAEFMEQDEYKNLSREDRVFIKGQVDTALGVETEVNFDDDENVKTDSIDYGLQWKTVQSDMKQIEKDFKKLTKKKELRHVVQKHPAMYASLKAMGGLMSGIAAGVGVASAVLNFFIPGVDLFTEPATALMKPVATTGKLLTNAGSPMKTHRGNFDSRSKDGKKKGLDMDRKKDKR